MLIGGFIF